MYTTDSLVVGGSSRRGAVVADQLEAANDLTNGEEAEQLGGQDTASGQLGGGHAASGLDDGGRGLDELGGVLELLEGALESGLEGSKRGRSHLLGVEDEAGQLETDAGVVDDKGSLSLNEVDDLAGAAADAAQGSGQTLGGTGNSRAGSGQSGAGSSLDTRQTLGSLGADVGSSLPCLGSGVGGCCGGGVGGLETARSRAAQGQARRGGYCGADSRHCVRMLCVKIEIEGLTMLTWSIRCRLEIAK